MTVYGGCRAICTYNCKENNIQYRKTSGIKTRKMPKFTSLIITIKLQIYKKG